MPVQQKIFATLAAVCVLLFILELVRRRRLREEYAVLWVLTGLAMIVLTVWYELLVGITELIGAVLPTTTLFLFGLLFLVVIAVHFSVVLSRLSDQVRILSQELALARARAPQDGANGAATPQDDAASS